MKDNQELNLFIKQLLLIIDELQNCNDEQVKKHIYDDLLFFNEIIKTLISKS